MFHIGYMSCLQRGRQYCIFSNVEASEVGLVDTKGNIELAKAGRMARRWVRCEGTRRITSGVLWHSRGIGTDTS